MPVVARTVLLLIGSNVFMTFAWYAHLRHLNQKPWLVVPLWRRVLHVSEVGGDTRA